MYPAIEPYQIGYLPVTGGHTLYFEECGNPEGIPVIFLHGGPGGGIHPDMRRFFDPGRYRIILFDQRGCGKSTPRAETRNNTIQDLVSDIDRLQKHLGIKKWGIMGTSWGSALAMFYAIKHPENTAFIILVGVFLADQEGKNLLCEGTGAKEYFPLEFEMYQSLIPSEKQGNGLGTAYNDILKSSNLELIREAVARFILWSGSTAGIRADEGRIRDIYSNTDYYLPLAKIYLHFATEFYGDDKRQYILEGAKKLSEIPCAIFHGELDYNCPVENALALHQAYRGSIMHIVSGAGHSAREEKNAKAICSYTDRLAESADF